MKISIDFGITTTDVVTDINNKLSHYMMPSDVKISSIQSIKNIKKKIKNCEKIQNFILTGGHHYKVKNKYENVPITHINEVKAIASGGLYLAKIKENKPTIIVSAGTGTACVYAKNNFFSHILGTSIGGGTLLGLSKLILKTYDPSKIDELALKGNSKSVDYILKEVVSGKIGNLNSNATAVNFGKIIATNYKFSKEDIAAGLISLITQAIARSVINVVNQTGTSNIVFTGRTSCLKSVKKSIIKNLSNQNFCLNFPKNRGFATSLGALVESKKTRN